MKALIIIIVISLAVLIGCPKTPVHNNIPIYEERGYAPYIPPVGSQPCACMPQCYTARQSCQSSCAITDSKCYDKCIATYNQCTSQCR
jgi:hypothetical protein